MYPIVTQMCNRDCVLITSLVIFVTILLYGMISTTVGGISIQQQNEEIYASTGSNSTCIVMSNIPCSYGDNNPYNICYYLQYHPVDYVLNIQEQTMPYNIKDFEPEDFPIGITVPCYSYNFANGDTVVIWKRNSYSVISMGYLISGIVCLCLTVIIGCICITYICISRKNNHKRHVVL